jgi:hypothetical protein
MDEVEVSSTEQVAPVETEIQNEVQETAVQEDRNQRNWKEINRAKRELEQKTKMQEELIERLMRTQPQVAQVQEVDELDTIDDKDYLNKNHSKRLVQKQIDPLQKRIDELESLVRRQSAKSSFDSIKIKYPDFDDIVNPETTALLEETDPELAQTIIELKDPYKIGMQTYKYIKAMNLAAEVPNSRRSKEVDKKIEQNKKTIQSPQAFDKRPMAQAFKMTESEKTKIYEEMMGYASQAGFSY